MPTIYHVKVHIVKNVDDPSSIVFFLKDEDALEAYREASETGQRMYKDSQEFPMSPAGLLLAMEWAAGHAQSTENHETPDPLG